MTTTATIVQLEDGSEVLKQAITFSDALDKFAPALVKAQKAMGPIRKTLTANIKSSKANYSYDYADLAEVLEAITPALNDNGIASLQPPAAQYLERGIVFVHVVTILLHESGQWARNILVLRPTADDPQSIGSAITYARRYAIQGMCNVASERDDDGGRASRKRDKEPEHQDRPVEPEPINPVTQDEILDLFSKLNFPTERRDKGCLYASRDRETPTAALSELYQAEALTLKAHLKRELEKMTAQPETTQQSTDTATDTATKAQPETTSEKPLQDGDIREFHPSETPTEEAERLKAELFPEGPMPT